MKITDTIKDYLILEEEVDGLNEQLKLMRETIETYIATRPLRGVAIKESERISPKWKEEFQSLAGKDWARLEKEIKARTPPSISRQLVIDKEVFLKE